MIAVVYLLLCTVAIAVGGRRMARRWPWDTWGTPVFYGGVLAVALFPVLAACWPALR